MMLNIFSFLRRGLQMRRNFSTTCTTLGTRGEKLQADAALCGRSMVEMLGVLAIIGVLSVGAMSGYAKAMLKYKLNKQTEQLNSILVGFIQYRHEWKNVQGTVRLKNYFIKLGLVPENMDKDSSDYLYDAFNNKILLTTNGIKDDGTRLTMGISYAISSDSAAEICQNVYQTSKGFSEDLYRIAMTKTAGENSDYSESSSFYGNTYCHTRKCLSSASLSEIHEVCQFCDDAKTCNIWLSVPMGDIYGQ